MKTNLAYLKSLSKKARMVFSFFEISSLAPDIFDTLLKNL